MRKKLAIGVTVGFFLTAGVFLVGSRLLPIGFSSPSEMGHHQPWSETFTISNRPARTKHSEIKISPAGEDRIFVGVPDVDYILFPRPQLIEADEDFVAHFPTGGSLALEALLLHHF